MKFISFTGVVLSLLALLASSTISKAQTASLAVIYTFPAGSSRSDIFLPTGPLVQDNSGTLYGVTQFGGAYDIGSIFSVTPDGNFSVVHSFELGEGDGEPIAGLLCISDGTLYGTTRGDDSTSGSIFKLTPDGAYTVLHDFDFNGSDGAGPAAALIIGSDGNFYGTTWAGGTNSVGTVFQLTPAGVLTTLHSFTTAEGTSPESALVEGLDGNFYGITALNEESGHLVGTGSLFSVAPDGTFTVLHHFDAATDGQPTPNAPYSSPGLVRGRDGAFYGVNPVGGANGHGTVYKVTATGEFTVLHTFTAEDESGRNVDGATPTTTLLDGGDGYFYSATAGGGANGDGTLFSITPDGVLTTLYNVDNAYTNPSIGFLKGLDGRFYFVSQSDGANDHGTVDAFTVSSPPVFFAGQAALDGGVYYLSFPSGNFFGYYSFLSDPAYIYHFDLGFEYVFDANDGKSGVYLYDFASSTFFYTSPTFPFPYLYDFTLNTVIYYYPDPNNAGHYNTDGIRYFYDFNTGQIITK